MERIINLAPTFLSEKVRFFQFERRFFNWNRTTAFFTKEPQGRNISNRPTRRSRRTHDNTFPGWNGFQLERDLQMFYRSLRLNTHFGLSPNVVEQMVPHTDTGHFIRIIKGLRSIPPTSWLVTLDVNSLYTSISHNRGMEATKSLLIYPKVPYSSVWTYSNLCYMKKNFLYEDSFYIQKQGTAMGSHVAPAYANAYMNELEVKYIFNNSLNLTNSSLSANKVGRKLHLRP
ncbi:unnamed protein product [Ranitomeya imitator]|uniref:Reverse transcriptase domain-containing protein n=1 Tax=Ranitomeya imitator TaxID=111125 RepID=A0ABN9KMC3_9NEOB|nr:unnamed protein product [Ranitomeya imitator]